MLVVSVLVTPLCSFISTYIDKAGLGAEYYWIMFGTQELLFIAHHFTAPSFAIYGMALNGTLRGRGRKFYLAFFTPFLICELLILTNIFTGRIFYYSDFHYVRGNHMPLLYLIAIVYYIIGLAQMFIGRRTLDKRNWAYLILCYVVIAAGILIQLFVPSIMCEYFGESLGTVIVMVAFEENTKYLDYESGLFDRHGFFEDLRVAKVAKRPYRLIIVRIAEMKQLRNIMDYPSFEHLLTNVANGIAARKEGEEAGYSYDVDTFVFLVDSLDQGYLDRRVEEIKAFLDRPLDYGAGTLSLSATINTVRVPENVSTEKEIISICEGTPSFVTGSVVVRSQEDAEKVMRRLRVEEAVQRAIEEKTLSIYIQPIWWAKSDRIRSGEVLARLFDPELGNIAPFEFIPIAERAGLMPALGELVMEKTCAYLAANSPEEMGLEGLEINVSPYQLPAEDIRDRFREIMKAHGIPIRMVNLEITETYDIDSSDLIMKNVLRLKEAGFDFSIDDFGTGYSNFSILSSGIYTNLKIDRSILLKATTSGGRQLLRTIYEMAQAMGLYTIQEGVETEEQLALVRSFGVDMIQGYYFSKPVPPDDFTAYVRRYNTAAAAKQA